jgi:antitoxin HicB
MGTAWVYPATLEPDDNGTLLVSFRDVPEAHTFGDDETEALRRGVDALVTALEGYIASRRQIPQPSAIDDEARAVVLPMVSAAKLELYEAMRERGWRKADLAKRLGWHAPQVDRLLDLRHTSRFDQLQSALAVLDRTLIVRGTGLRAGVSLPTIVPAGTRYEQVRKRILSVKGRVEPNKMIAKRSIRKAPRTAKAR